VFWTILRMELAFLRRGATPYLYFAVLFFMAFGATVSDSIQKEGRDRYRVPQRAGHGRTDHAGPDRDRAGDHDSDRRGGHPARCADQGARAAVHHTSDAARVPGRAGSRVRFSR